MIKNEMKCVFKLLILLITLIIINYKRTFIYSFEY